MQYQRSMINNLIMDLHEIPLKEIQMATRDFSAKTRLEDDKSCNIYKGKLSRHDHEVAIKVHNGRRSVGMDKFVVERLVCVCSSHENIIPFIGFCFEGNNKITVTDYATNGSLDRHLHDTFKRFDLSWAQRLEICLGAAKGLKHLQSCLEKSRVVVDRNVQSKYILLDENMKAKVCGLSFIGLGDEAKRTSGATHYYMDPISIESGILNKWSDVYAFGVVLFELMSGMLACEQRSIGDVKPQHLIKLVRRYYNVGLDNLIDPIIRGEIDRRSFYSVKEIAYKCISLNIKDRPTMDVIIKTIEEALDTHNHGAESIVTIRSRQHQNAKDFKIPLADINAATKNFSFPIDHGSTQFRKTYEGQLPDRFQNRKATIIRYDPKHGHHRDEFLNELDMMCSFRHENIIRFIGYCEEDEEMILVSEYASNGSLYSHLSLPAKRCCMTWAQRLQICLGAAKGLKYLHSGLGDRGRVIHRTFSSKQILLDDKMETKIYGFGSSTLVPRNQQQVYQPMEAWLYKDPVYHASDILTTEVDMYSFGILMFELLMGMLYLPPKFFGPSSSFNLMNEVRKYHRVNPYRLVDYDIRDQVDSGSLRTYIEVAYKCTSFNLKDRPSMNSIVKILEKLLNLQKNRAVSTTTIPNGKIEDCKIPLHVLKRATNEFNTESQIGNGGFGIVYKGKLYDQRWQNRIVAIKRLNPQNHQAGNKEFHKELQLIFSFHHENIIPFIGYCDEENEMIIVTEYAVNGSLDCHLEDPTKRRRLTWEQRLKICLGAAKGLKHLHSGHGEYNEVIHRDVKSGNILLDENMEAKICDFGLSRSRPINQATDTGLYTSVGGTEFYLDPIYREGGKLRTESDVYSFGVVLFEMLSGELAYNPIKYENGKPQLLINLVRRYKSGILDKLMDSFIKDEIHDRSFYTFQDIAYECINLNYKERPTMDKIIDRIEEALEYQVKKNILSKVPES